MSYYEDFEENLLGSLEHDDAILNRYKEEFEVEYVFQKCKDKWIMKNGQEIVIKDMTTKHIINSLNMILKICQFEGWKATDYNIYNKLRKELDRRNSNEK